MRNALLATTGLAILTAPAHAGGNVREEIYIRPSNYQESVHPDYRPMPAAPTVRQFWSGSHVGAQVITGRAKTEYTGPTGVGSDFKSKGIGGMVTVGRDWQKGSVVMGVAADVGHRNAQGDDSFALGQKDELELGLTGAARARVGVVVGGRALAYVTGGVAATRAEYRVYDASINQGSDKSETLSGPTYGAGLEVAFNPRTAGRIEVRRTDYGNVTKSDPSVVNGSRKYEVQDTAILVGLTRKLSY